MSRLRTGVAVGALAFAATTVPSAQADIIAAPSEVFGNSSWTIRVLQGPGPDAQSVNDMNVSGEVAGEVVGSDSQPRAAFWDVTGSLKIVGSANTRALAINGAGMMVGDHDDIGDAAAWIGSEEVILPNDGVGAEALDVNDDGVTVGLVKITDSLSNTKPVYWTFDADGTPTLHDIPVPADFDWTQATAINNSGVVGVSGRDTSTGHGTGYLYNIATQETTLLPGMMELSAISDDGTVIGQFSETLGIALLPPGAAAPIKIRSYYEGGSCTTQANSVSGELSIVGPGADKSGACVGVLWPYQRESDPISLASLVRTVPGYETVTDRDLGLPQGINDNGEILLHNLVLVPVYPPVDFVKASIEVTDYPSGEWQTATEDGVVEGSETRVSVTVENPDRSKEHEIHVRLVDRETGHSVGEQTSGRRP